MSDLDTSVHPILRSLRKTKLEIIEKELVAGFGKWLLNFVYRRKLVPLNRLLFLRRLVRGQDPLFPKFHTLRTTAGALQNEFLPAKLGDMELGSWSLTASALNFFERQIRVLRPKVVLEFGSGTSSACLARYMYEVHGDANHIHVYSIDQEPYYAEKTVLLLKALHLDKCARVVHSPLRWQTIEGMETVCYDLPPDFLNILLEGKSPDFIVIDGPSSADARFGTLPLVRPFIKGSALFFLDDVLRDGELRVARLWSHLPYVRICGMHPVGKGLLVGRISSNDWHDDLAHCRAISSRFSERSR